MTGGKYLDIDRALDTKALDAFSYYGFVVAKNKAMEAQRKLEERERKARSQSRRRKK